MMDDEERINKVVHHVLTRMGHQYDLKNIIDLARFLWPMPLVPSYYRRRMIALGSGDATKAICSTLIADAFLRVDFPILPPAPAHSFRGEDYTFVCPRDFDMSPYFQIIKPRLPQNEIFSIQKEIRERQYKLRHPSPAVGSAGRVPVV